MIPKIIHYCWYGNNKKTKLINQCIYSWKKYFPDYEIIEWNENNTDIYENKYIEKAYEEKKWAFVSDYVRMKVLSEYGGIYFDTDVEVLKPFPQEILKLEAFSGFESFSLKLSPGLVFACEPKNPVVEQMVQSYNNDQFELGSVDDVKTINVRITEMLMSDGLREVDEQQIVDGITVFPSKIFCPYDGKRRRVNIQPESLTVHYYAASWFPWHRKLRLKLGTILRRMVYR